MHLFFGCDFLEFRREFKHAVTFQDYADRIGNKPLAPKVPRISISLSITWEGFLFLYSRLWAVAWTLQGEVPFCFVLSFKVCSCKCLQMQALQDPLNCALVQKRL